MHITIRAILEEVRNERMAVVDCRSQDFARARAPGSAVMVPGYLLGGGVAGCVLVRNASQQLKLEGLRGAMGE